MIGIFKQRINIHTDCLLNAIEKKANNNSLSSKTLDKIVRITNTQYNLKSNEAKFIFCGDTCVKKTESKGLHQLIKDIKSITSVKNSSFISARIALWESNAKNLLGNSDEDKCYGERIGKGSRGCVYKDGDFIMKKIKNQKTNELLHEASMCNEYNIKMGKPDTVATIIDGCIKMPFVSGNKTDVSETISGVRELYRMGFMMGDAKPSNFLKSESGDVVPVDFGLVIMRDKLENVVPAVKIKVIFDYIKGGFHYIPGELKKEYIDCINKFDESLGQESPMRKMNTKELSRAGF